MTKIKYTYQTEVGQYIKISPGKSTKAFQEELEDYYPLKSFKKRPEAVRYLRREGYKPEKNDCYINKDAKIARLYALRDATHADITYKKTEKEEFFSKISSVNATKYYSTGWLVSFEQRRPDMNMKQPRVWKDSKFYKGE